jgi:glycosyltransferase involved in cell wall biosynthesis
MFNRQASIITTKTSTCLKVTHVVLSLDVGGLERNVINQVREGQKLGQDVSVLCLERPGVLADHVRDLNARVLSMDKRPGIRPSLIGRLRALLRELRPDVVHTHQIASLFYTGLATRGREDPLLVHTEHGKEKYAERLRTRWLGRLGGRYAARFYCLSEDMAKAVIASRIVPKDKVYVIGNGIEMERFRQQNGREQLRHSLGIAPSAPVIGTVGRLTDVKKQDLLLRAFKQVKTELPGSHLLLVGDGPLMGDLQKQAVQLDVERSVHFLGYQAETERFYPVMDVFALTSRSEGIPQSVLEASAAGLPVIASRVGGVPEVIQDGQTGLLFSSGNEAELTAGLKALLTNPSLARQLGEAGRRHVETRFDVRSMAADYHRHFLELLAQK